jgi:hypothetical protein
MRKRCWIRGEDKGKKCPFGLPIALACQHAGESVTHMCPLEALPGNKRERVALANRRVYMYHKNDQRCLYAVNVFDEAKAVNCDFGDVAQGMGGPAFSGSALYTQTFSGVGLDGLYAFPMGYYADNNESRNLFQGLFSLLGSSAMPGILRTALLTSGNLWDKLRKGESLTQEERAELENVVGECRQEFEDGRRDSAKARELADKWNPRLLA